MPLLRPNTDKVIPRFLHYYLLSREWRSVVEGNVISGATVDRIPLSLFPDFKMRIPDLPVQQHVVSVLSAYDDLIENNQRRIRLLDQTARLIYKEWFVHLRFPGHDRGNITDGVPEGWERKTLAEIADITMGQSPKSINYNENHDGLPFHQGVTHFGDRFPTHKMYCTVQDRIAEKGDILFSVRAPVGRTNIANKNDETRKRFEVMCREVFKKFRACINVKGVNEHRADRDAIDIVYKSLQRDREQADISDIIRKLHEVVDEAIEVRPNTQAEKQAPYDISRIDFDRLKREFERSAGKRTTVQALNDAVEKKLRRLLAENPLRTDFQRHYEEIVAEYNREKDRVTIERTFEALLKLVQEPDDEESRAVREGLDEESLAVFDLLKRPDLSGSDIRRIKQVAVELLRTLKTEKLRVDR